MAPLLLALQVLIAAPPDATTSEAPPPAQASVRTERVPAPTWSTWLTTRLAHVVEASAWGAGAVLAGVTAQVVVGIAGAAALGELARRGELGAVQVPLWGRIDPGPAGGAGVFLLMFLVAAPWLAHVWDFLGFNAGVAVLGAPTRQMRLAAVSALIPWMLSFGLGVVSLAGAGAMALVFINAQGWADAIFPRVITYQVTQRQNDFYVASVMGGLLQILALSAGLSLLAVPAVTGLGLLLFARPLLYLSALAIDERGPGEREPHHVP